jgi:hypothetical protein
MSARGVCEVYIDRRIVLGIGSRRGGRVNVPEMTAIRRAMPQDR